MNNALSQLDNITVKVLTTDTAGPKITDRLSNKEMSMSFSYDVFFARRIAGACISLGLLKRLPGSIRDADVVHLTSTFSFPTLPTLFLWGIGVRSHAVTGD